MNGIFPDLCFGDLQWYPVGKKLLLLRRKDYTAHKITELGMKIHTS